MDRERFKRRETAAPKRRSINGEEKPVVKPAISVEQIVSAEPPKAPIPVRKDDTQATESSVVAPVKTEPIPELFDGDEDDDLFGVWETQKKLKKARQQKEMQQKAEKLAEKMLKKQQKKEAKKAAKPHEFALSVSVPRISKFRKKHPRLLYALLGVVVVAIGSSAYGIVATSKSNSGGTTEVLGQASAKPDFATVYSSSDNAGALKYDASKKVASYSDAINGTTITVSQQLLPSSFKSDPTGEVAKLATQINATEKISASDITAYAGLSIKGPQTVVFAKNDLLIFIIADKKIETLDWIKYLQGIK